jgi:hypothetical protein
VGGVELGLGRETDVGASGVGTAGGGEDVHPVMRENTRITARRIDERFFIFNAPWNEPSPHLLAGGGALALI